MYSDNLVLREVILTGLTTKGSDLTATEVDQNFIYLWQDLKAKAATGAASLPAYNGAKTYTLGEVVGYTDATWLYVNAVDDAGVEPGSDADYWLSIELESLVHAQNTDTWLDKYGANAVSAAELRAFVDAGSSSTNFANTDLTLDADRTHDLAGNEARLLNGQVVFGGTGSVADVNSAVTVETAGTIGLKASAATVGLDGVANSGIGSRGTAITGIGGQFEGSAQGVAGYSFSGTAVHGESANLAANLKGRIMAQPYGGSNSIDGSALVQFDSTISGILIPRMTTAQIDAIVSPATGLQVINIDRNRPEFYNGSYFQGNQQSIYIGHTQWSAPADSATAIFGSMPDVPQTSLSLFSAFDIEMRGSGVIRACTFNTWAGGLAGTNESWSLYIRVNSTDYLVQTISTVGPIRQFKNTALNIPYVDGDIVCMVYVNPNWGTNPTSVAGSGLLITR